MKELRAKQLASKVLSPNKPILMVKLVNKCQGSILGNSMPNYSDLILHYGPLYMLS